MEQWFWVIGIAVLIAGAIIKNLRYTRRMRAAALAAQAGAKVLHKQDLQVTRVIEEDDARTVVVLEPVAGGIAFKYTLSPYIVRVGYHYRAYFDPRCEPWSSGFMDSSGPDYRLEVGDYLRLVACG